MIPISELLLPSQVNLELTADDQASGVNQVLSLLNGDSRVQDWQALAQAVIQRNAGALVCHDCSICIAHGRTDAVSSLVIAAGRSTKGLVFPGAHTNVRLVFVAGIPSAFDSEYLRVVGVIARLCRDQVLLERLLHVQEPSAFVDLLASEEGRL